MNKEVETSGRKDLYIPTKEEILEICRIFGCESDIQHYVGFSQELGDVAKEESITDAHIELVDMHSSSKYYLGGKMSDIQIQKSRNFQRYKADAKESGFYEMLIGFHRIPIKEHKIIFERIRKDPDGGLPNIKIVQHLLACILLIKVQNKVSPEKRKHLHKLFGDIVHVLLAAPYYIQAADSKTQESFFKLLLRVPQLENSFRDPHNFIWSYLDKLFPNNNFLNKKFSEYADKSTQNQVQETKTATENILTPQKGTLIQKGELKMLIDVFPFPISTNEVQIALEIIAENKSSEAVIKFYHNPKDIDANTLDKNSTLYGYKNWETLSRIEQRKLIRKESFSLLECGILALICSKEKTIDIHRGKFNIYSFMLLCYPDLLNKLPKNESEVFFELFFQSVKITPLSNISSDLWKFIIKYFGNNEVVQKYYKLLKSIEERNVQKTAQIESTRVESVSAKEENGKIHLNANQFLAPWERLHVAIWKATKTKKKQGEADFYIFSSFTDIQIEKPQEHYILEIQISSRTNVYTISNYNKGDFVELGVKKEITPKIRQKKDTEKNRKKNKPKPLKEKLETEIIVPDLESLQTGVALLLEDMNAVKHSIGDSGRITLSFDNIDEILEESRCSRISHTQEIIFDGNMIPPKLISFFGIQDFKITDIELGEILQKLITQIINEEESKKQKQIRKNTEKSILQLPKLPSEYNKAEKFFKACEKEELIHSDGNNQYYIWQLAFGNSVSKKIERDIHNLGYNIRFERNNGALETIHILSQEDTNIFALFDISTDIHPENSLPISGNYTKEQLGVLQHILGQIISYIVFTLYNSPHRKKQKSSIEKKIIERESVRQEVKQRLNSGTASFIYNYKVLEKESVSWDHPDILAFPILGRKAHIRVSQQKLSSEKRLQEFEILKEQIILGELDELVIAFHKRLLKTKGDISTKDSTVLRNPSAKKLVKEADYISPSVEIENIRDQVIYMLEDFHDNKLFIQLIDAIEFSYRELEEK